MLIDIGCEFTHSNPRDPSGNGVSERSNRTLVDLARTLLIDSKMRKNLWAEAVQMSSEILNAITVNKATGKTAFEIFHRRKPYFGKFYPFGTRCTVLDQDPDRKKFDPKGLPVTLVGLNGGTYGFRVLIDGTRKVAVSKHVRFQHKSAFARSVSARPEEDDAQVFEDKPEDEETTTQQQPPSDTSTQVNEQPSDTDDPDLQSPQQQLERSFSKRAKSNFAISRFRRI